MKRALHALVSLSFLVAAVIMANHQVSEDDQDSPVKYLTAVVTSNPVNAVGVIGGSVSYTFGYTTVIPTPPVAFQWQVQIGGSDKVYLDLVETAGVYEGVTGQTLTVKSIDNYLASRPGVNFRCQILILGAVPTFTPGASLTVPIHTDWTPRASCLGNGDGPSGTVVTDTILPPVATGLTGPLTYLWSYVSGTTMTCDAPTSSAPTFSRNFGGPTPGNFASFWKCTISDGTHTVDTDPLLVLVAMQIGVGYQDDAAQPDGGFANRGGGITTIFQIPASNVKWNNYFITLQRKFRCPAAPNQTLSTPQIAGGFVTVGFNLASLPTGGTANACIVYAELVTIIPAGHFDSNFFGIGSDGFGCGNIWYGGGGDF